MRRGAQRAGDSSRDERDAWRRRLRAVRCGRGDGEDREWANESWIRPGGGARAIAEDHESELDASLAGERDDCDDPLRERFGTLAHRGTFALHVRNIPTEPHVADGGGDAGADGDGGELEGGEQRGEQRRAKDDMRMARRPPLRGHGAG